MKFNTEAVHAGQSPEEITGAVIPPIYQTSTYAQHGPGEHLGYEYTRAGNPNFTRLEQQLATLEGGQFATVFSSGLGATTALLMQCRPGDHVVAVDDVYGGTFRLLHRLSEQFGLKLSFVAGTDVAEWRTALTEKTRYMWLESPSNPLLRVVDIAALSALAHEDSIPVVVDNTFASPYLQQPLTLGADIVLHSTTKYIGGHSDVIGGALITNDAKAHEAHAYARMAYGLNPSPFDTWLTTRGAKTLGLRMQQHVRNAQLVAAFLQQHARVRAVHYPGLPNHPQHELARRQMPAGPGGMVSADIDCSPQQLKAMLSHLKLFCLAESLGGVESLVCHPATMTHASVPPELRARRGISDTLLRFSVGIEDADDLLADLDRALAQL